MLASVTGNRNCETDSVFFNFGVRKVEDMVVVDLMFWTSPRLDDVMVTPSLEVDIVTELDLSSWWLEIDKSAVWSDDSGAEDSVFSGLTSFKSVESLGLGAGVTVVSGAPIRMLSRKLSMMASLDFMSSSTSLSSSVLLNELVLVFPNTSAFDLYSSVEELFKRLSMVILKLNMLSRKPSITFSLSFKSLIFLSEDWNSLRNERSFKPSLLFLTSSTFRSALK